MGDTTDPDIDSDHHICLEDLPDERVQRFSLEASVEMYVRNICI